MKVYRTVMLPGNSEAIAGGKRRVHWGKVLGYFVRFYLSLLFLRKFMF